MAGYTNIGGWDGQVSDSDAGMPLTQRATASSKVRQRGSPPGRRDALLAPGEGSSSRFIAWQGPGAARADSARNSACVKAALVVNRHYLAACRDVGS
jgi:hypothetical protein